MRQNELGLVLVVPYDGCNVIEVCILLLIMQYIYLQGDTFISLLKMQVKVLVLLIKIVMTAAKMYWHIKANFSANCLVCIP